MQGQGPWSPLRVRVFRSLWIAALVSNVGTYMHIVAAGWAMTNLSDSPTLVGLVSTMWAVPGFLLALHAGALADMIDRRRLITLTQIAALAVAGALGLLVWIDQLSVTSLLIGTFLESVALTLAAPAFMALTPQLVDAGHLPQAIGLDAVSRNISQTIGPALAGAVIAVFNPGAVFLLNAVSFVGVVIVVRRYRPPRSIGTRPSTMNSAIGEGLRHIVASTQLRNIALRVTIISTTTASLAAMLPVVARKSLHVSANGFGLLSGAMGIGSVLAVWVLPTIRVRTSIETTVFGAAAVWSAGTALFANTAQLWVAVIALVICGAGMMAMLNALFSTFTVQLPDRVRGRGSSLAMLTVWLGASIGALGWGLVASAYGVSAALTAAAIVNGIAAVISRWALPIGKVLPFSVGSHESG
ncbi:MAG: MFS transporter [Ilumatobacteraceae bacterium]